MGESQDPIFNDLHKSPMAVEDVEKDELLSLGPLAPSVELEEREVLTLLDSPMSSPPSTPAHSNNTPSLEFLRSSRSFIGDLVYRHFGNSYVQKSILVMLCHSSPRLFAL